MTHPLDVPPADPNSTPEKPEPDEPHLAPKPGEDPDATPANPAPKEDPA